MKYYDYLTTVYNLLTGTTVSGSSIYIQYTEIQLEDLLELNPNCFPNQDGYSAFLCPVPFTLEDDNSATYVVRVYIAAQIKEDATDRMQKLGNCITLLQKFIQQIPDNINGVAFPITITPVLLWDFQGEGAYADLSIRMGVECL